MNKKYFPFIFPFLLVITIDAMSFGIVTPLLASLIDEVGLLGGTETTRHITYGILQALSPLCYMLGAPLLGYFSDRLGRKKILLYCIGGSFLGLLGYAAAFFWESLSILIIARIIVGLTSGSLAVAQAAIADLTEGAEKAKSIGAIAIAMTIGLVAGPLLGGVLSDTSVCSYFTDQTPFSVALLLTILGAIILMNYVEETNRPSILLSPPRHLLHSVSREMIALWRNDSIRYLLLTFFLFELGWSLYYSALPLLLTLSFHSSNKVIGIFSAYVGVMLSLWLWLGVRMVTRFFSLKKIIQPSLIIGAVSLLIAASYNILSMQAIMAITIALSVALCYSILITLMSDLALKQQQGLLLGSSDALLSLAFAITGFLAGILTLHSAILPEIISAVFFVMAMLLFRVRVKSE